MGRQSTFGVFRAHAADSTHRSDDWSTVAGFQRADAGRPGGINPSFGPPKNVLELFTSQGCDTCPPADRCSPHSPAGQTSSPSRSPSTSGTISAGRTRSPPTRTPSGRRPTPRRAATAPSTRRRSSSGMIGVNGSDPAAIEEAIKITDETSARTDGRLVAYDVAQLDQDRGER